MIEIGFESYGVQPSGPMGAGGRATFSPADLREIDRRAGEAAWNGWDARRTAQIMAVKRANREAIEDVAKQLERELDEDAGTYFKSRTGKPVANWAFTTSIYPKRGLAWEPAGVVKSRAPEIIGLFARGGEVAPRNGSYLMIPIPDAPVRSFIRPGSASPYQQAVARFGKPSWRPLKNGTGFLVLFETSMGRTGKVRSAFGQRKGQRVRRADATWTPFFIARRAALRVTPQLETLSIIDRAVARFPDAVAASLSRLLGEVERA